MFPLLDDVRILRGQDGLKIGVAPQALSHEGRPSLFVVKMSGIQVASHLVLENPCKFSINLGGIRIVLQSLFTQEIDATLDPAPSLLGLFELFGDVVDHVP